MEQVVLLDDAGEQIGVADKATVHTTETPLHLAFSCYVFDDAGRFLLTRRALTKLTWPGVWTNTCCGHPAPGEAMEAAIERRLTDELGCTVAGVELILPRFRYRTVMANGIVENELCPVYRAELTAGPAPDPSEVDTFGWIEWELFERLVSTDSLDISPWCRLQVAELAENGWQPGDAAQLPPAAR